MQAGLRRTRWFAVFVMAVAVVAVGAEARADGEKDAVPVQEAATSAPGPQECQKIECEDVERQVCLDKTSGCKENDCSVNYPGCKWCAGCKYCSFWGRQRFCGCIPLGSKCPDTINAACTCG